MRTAHAVGKDEIMSVRHTKVGTQLGELTLVADGDELTGLYFPHHWYRPPEESFGRRVPAAADDPVFGEASRQLAEYLAGTRRSFDLPLAARGDDFQQRVWALIRAIPYGETRSYADLADELGDRRLAQEVGQAVGRNPLSVIVPCHRVVGSRGQLTGYAGGLKRKQFLLRLEEPAPALAGRLF
jgi:methylated-DNA-[protein]-cysteine S-methyltransferase